MWAGRIRTFPFRRRWLFFGTMLATLPGAASIALAQHVETFTYDAHGRLATIQRSSNRTTDYALDAASNRATRESFEQYDALWQAESLQHAGGHAVTGGWGANVATSPAHITFGPYTPSTPTGMNTASWRIAVDNTSSPDASYVVTLDVWDATANVQLAAKTLNRHDWLAANTLQDFELPFVLASSSSGHQLEFRTFYHGAAAIAVDQIGYRHSGSAWQAASELPHNIGYAATDGWVAEVSMSGGYMTYGPYAGTSQGARTATWRMKVDDAAHPDASPVVVLDVWDATANQQLASITLSRHAWATSNTFQTFELPFIQDASRAGHAMEFRTLYQGAAQVTVQWIGIR